MNKKHAVLMFFMSLTIYTNLSSIFFVDWFRSSLTKAGKNIEKLTQLRNRLEIKYDDVFDVIHTNNAKKIKRKLKKEILRKNYSFPFTTYIQGIDDHPLTWVNVYRVYQFHVRYPGAKGSFR